MSFDNEKNPEVTPEPAGASEFVLPEIPEEEEAATTEEEQIAAEEESTDVLVLRAALKEIQEKIGNVEEQLRDGFEKVASELQTMPPLKLNYMIAVNRVLFRHIIAEFQILAGEENRRAAKILEQQKQTESEKTEEVEEVTE